MIMETTEEHGPGCGCEDCYWARGCQQACPCCGLPVCEESDAVVEHVENPYGEDILARFVPDYDRPVRNKSGVVLGYGALVYPVDPSVTSLPVAFDDDYGTAVVLVSCANMVVG